MELELWDMLPAEQKYSYSQSSQIMGQTGCIELLCTSGTVDEVYRVIGAEVDRIKSIAGVDMPVSNAIIERLNPNIEIGDFYTRYYEWCLIPGNKAGDYMAFCSYLSDLVQQVLSDLTIKQSGVYKVGKKADEYDEQVISLIEYKNKRKLRNTTRSSAETDVANLFDLLKVRAGKRNSIWQTNDFIVSADHRLIEWANEIYAGVPLVVLPSVWLSILLRYTGRSDDDYKSFCLFLTQRQRANAAESVDAVMLLQAINARTNRTDLKERIISEIIQNKAQYSFSSPEEYDSSADKAFDAVLNDYDEKTRSQLASLRAELIEQNDKNAKLLTVSFKNAVISIVCGRSIYNIYIYTFRQAAMMAVNNHGCLTESGLVSGISRI